MSHFWITRQAIEVMVAQAVAKQANPIDIPEAVSFSWGRDGGLALIDPTLPMEEGCIEVDIEPWVPETEH